MNFDYMPAEDFMENRPRARTLDESLKKPSVQPSALDNHLHVSYLSSFSIRIKFLLLQIDFWSNTTDQVRPRRRRGDCVYQSEVKFLINYVLALLVFNFILCSFLSIVLKLNKASLIGGPINTLAICRAKPLAIYLFSNQQSVVNDFEHNTRSGSLVVNDVIMQHSGSTTLGICSHLYFYNFHTVHEYVFEHGQFFTH